MENKTAKSLIPLMALSLGLAAARAQAQVYKEPPQDDTSIIERWDDNISTATKRNATFKSSSEPSDREMDTTNRPRMFEKNDLPDRDAVREDGKTEPRGETAQDSGKTLSDREIARKARRSVVEDKALSTSAHNVVIVARDGKVTLKGEVESEDEKNSVGAKVAAIIGAENVSNKLTVKTRK